MMLPELLRVGDDRMRCHAWHAGTHTVVLGPESTARPLRCSSIVRALDELWSHGVNQILTAAIDDRTAEPFLEAGFDRRERLVVYHHDLVGVDPSIRPRSLTRRRRRDVSHAARIDALAFTSSPPLDEGGIRSALGATPVARVDVHRPTGSTAPQGYVLCGIAGDTGYLQRLAVDPAWQRRGVARSLVNQSLGWFRTRGSHHVLVNTPEDNQGARKLYLATGFRRTDDRIAVYARRCEVR